MRLLYCKECGRIYFEYIVDIVYEDVVSVGVNADSMEGYLDQEAFSKNAKIKVIAKVDEATEATQYGKCPLMGSHHISQFIDLNIEECTEEFLKRIIPEDNQSTYRHIQLNELTAEDLLILKSVVDIEVSF